MTRYVGVDYGTKRIGLSVGDDEARIAAPFSNLQASGVPKKDALTVVEASDDYGPEAFVVGLPRNMDGSEGAQAELARAFGAALQEASERIVHYFDERLTSRAADELLRPADLTRGQRKARRDAVAAQLILQGFLDSRAGNARLG